MKKKKKLRFDILDIHIDFNDQMIWHDKVDQFKSLMPSIIHYIYQELPSLPMDFHSYEFAFWLRLKNERKMRQDEMFENRKETMSVMQKKHKHKYR